MSERRIILVSNRLPIAVEYREGQLRAQPTVGGLASALSALAQRRPLLWVGWPGAHTGDERERAEIERRLNTQMTCAPVFIPPNDFEKFYNGFSNNCLWPLFHYFPRLARYEQVEWEAYRRVNQLFCQRVLEVAQPGDVIWVHDYHLMLLPALLRAALPEAAIGFFLHIPFPSFELFRELPWREPLLRGLLGADLIGFHSYDYTRHNLSSLLRLLGLENDFGQLSVDNRLVHVDTFPLGINADDLSAAAEAEAVRRQAAGLRRRLVVEKIILSVDRLDFTKGIIERLLAFERFLEQSPAWRERTCLVLICAPSRTRVPAYRELKRQVDEMVGRLNGKFGTPGWTPIWYLYRSYSSTDLFAFYRAADVALITPLRDGMNLVAKEYLACRSDGSGALILSETAGAAAELGEAVLVNPNDIQRVAAAIDTALKMSPHEQAARNRPMRERLRRYTTARWAEDFLNRLDGVRARQPAGTQHRLTGQVESELVAAYAASRRRLILLDCDSLLAPVACLAQDASPPARIVSVLSQLAADPDNTIVVLSGFALASLESQFESLNVGVVAEHGAWLRPNAHARWRPLIEAGSEWMVQLRPMLEHFTDRTPGTVVEEKSRSLAWHYQLADPQLRGQRVKELSDLAESVIANTSLHLWRGNKVLEIKHSGVNKARAAAHWLHANPEPDFVLAIGDGEMDEVLFHELPKEAWSFRVGYSIHSHAHYTLRDSTAVYQLIETLAQWSVELHHAV